MYVKCERCGCRVDEYETKDRLCEKCYSERFSKVYDFMVRRMKAATPPPSEEGDE